MRRRGIRNGIFILGAFVLVGVLVVLVKFRPSAQVLPPESAEMQRLRFSRTENAWYALEEAVALIPEKPFVDPRTTVDYQFGPMGNLTGVYLQDDDPGHIAWVRGCGKAIARAREGLEMPQFLLPIDFQNVTSIWDDVAKADPFNEIPAVMLATAILEAREGADAEVVFGYFRDAVRLATTMHNSVPRHFLGSERSLGRAVRLFNAETQQKILDWLVEFNASKPAPRRAVEDSLRLAQAWKDGWKEVFTPFDPKHMPYVVASMIKSGPARRTLAANVDAVIDACSLPSSQFREWCQSHRELNDAASNSFPGFHPGGFSRRNGSAQARLDVLELVLAIELHRHKHGVYPDSLEALVPEFLPRVPINAIWDNPYYYRRADDAYWLALRGDPGFDPRNLIWSDIVVSPPGF